MRSRLVFFILATAFSQISCSVNILQTFANTKTDDALYEDALIAVNHEDYDTALTKIADMSTSYAAERKVIGLKASAYGGRCGFNFLRFVQHLTDMSGRLFPFLLTSFDSATSDSIDDCTAAQNLMLSLGANADRTNDENMFLTLIALAKVGSILSFYTDTSPHDGTADAAWDASACGTGGSRTAGASMTDADQREIGSGLTIAMSGLSYLAGRVNLGSGSLTAVTSACDQLTGPLASLNFCSVTDPTAFTSVQLQAIMGFVRENSAVGLGTCSGDITTCYCP